MSTRILTLCVALFALIGSSSSVAAPDRTKLPGPSARRVEPRSWVDEESQLLAGVQGEDGDVVVRYRKRSLQVRHIREVPARSFTTLLLIVEIRGCEQVANRLHLTQDTPEIWFWNRPPRLRSRIAVGAPAERSKQEQQSREAARLLPRRKDTPAHRHVVVGVDPN